MEDEAAQDTVPIIQLRVPGPWRSSQEFHERFAAAGDGAWTIDDEGVILNPTTGARFSLGHSEHDDEIADFFADTGRMSDEDVEALSRHAVKAHLLGPGGSVDASRAIMDAALVMLEAGGFGIYVDNSGIAHPPADWRKLTESSDDGGVYWAFVTLTAGRDLDGSTDEPILFSTGMHCLGYRDAEMDLPEDRQLGAFVINNFLGYCYQSGEPVIDGDSLDGLQGPLFRAVHRPCSRYTAGTAFHNPYGVWRLEPVDENE